MAKNQEYSLLAANQARSLVRYKNIHDESGTVDENAIRPADEREEYNTVMNQTANGN